MRKIYTIVHVLDNLWAVRSLQPNRFEAWQPLSKRVKEREIYGREIDKIFSCRCRNFYLETKSERKRKYKHRFT